MSEEIRISWEAYRPNTVLWPSHDRLLNSLFIASAVLVLVLAIGLTLNLLVMELLIGGFYLLYRHLTTTTMHVFYELSEGVLLTRFDPKYKKVAALNERNLAYELDLSNILPQYIGRVVLKLRNAKKFTQRKNIFIVRNVFFTTFIIAANNNETQIRTALLNAGLAEQR